MRVDDLFITEDISVLDAMRKLDETGLGVLFVAPEGVLRAVVTDGDIRRYILKSLPLEGPVREAANYSPYALPMEARARAKTALLEHGIGALPLLDKSELSIHEIAARVGVEDPFYFNRLFRRFYGMAPREYRKKIRGEKE